MTNKTLKEIIFANDSRHLLFWLCVIASIVLLAFPRLPAYTRWAFILLFLPSVFFIFRKESHLDHKKLVFIWVLSIFAGFVWDRIALSTNLWNFPTENVSVWFYGVPLEEYVFAMTFCTIVLGIYTSLPKYRQSIFDGPRLNDISLFGLIFVLQLLVLNWVFRTGAESYFKWLLILAIIPSLYFLWRKGEKIDEVRLFLTIIIFILVTIWYDYVFILSGSWYHHDAALIGRIGMIPADDILFGIFNAIATIGIYTSLPNKSFSNMKIK